jgi:hypothetical protein
MASPATSIPVSGASVLGRRSCACTLTSIGIARRAEHSRVLVGLERSIGRGLDVKELAAHMRPAGRFNQWILRAVVETVESRVAIGL